MALAVGDDIDKITWKHWCRFEQHETESMKSGKSWNVQASDLGDIDVLFEVKKGADGSVVWHDCKPLRRPRRNAIECPGCDFFASPHMNLDLTKPREGDSFEKPDPDFPGLTNYNYWCGRRDCSLQQKTICKALYGINTSSLLHVHVVFRRRNTGQMVTVLSSSKPNQIMGEDYEHDVGYYEVSYDSLICEEDRRLGAEISFALFCSEMVDVTYDTIHFTTHDDDESNDSANVSFSFFICDQNHDDDIKEAIMRAMRTWRWG